jgi:hypothetical protein
MPDERYLLPEWKPPFWKRTSVDRVLSVSALGIALLSAGLSFLSYRAADRQASAAVEQTKLAASALEAARAASKEQAADLERTRKAAEKSADAADGSRYAAAKSADVAQAQYENSIRLFYLDQRARVQHATTTIDELVPAKPILIRSQLKNVGKTPAIALQAKQWVRLRPTYQIDYEGHANVESTTDLGPEFAIWSSSEITPSEELINALKARKTLLWVYGIATYKDMFGPSELRELKWCAVFPANYSSSWEKRDFGMCPGHNISN